MRLLHFGNRPVRTKRPSPSATYSTEYIPAHRLVIEEATRRLREPRRERALNSNETVRKPLDKARQSTNARRHAQPLRLGVDEIPDGAILRDVRVGFRSLSLGIPHG